MYELKQPSAETGHVLDLLQRYTYAEVAEMTGWKKWRIHAAAEQYGKRKNEPKIQQRKAALAELMNQSVTCNALDLLDDIPDNSIHMWLTSIPYNIGKVYGGDPYADRMRHVYYHGFIMQVISEFARTLVPGGVVFLQVGTTQDDHGARVPLDFLFFNDLLDADLTFQNRIIWPSDHGLTPKRRLAERHETALVFSKGDEYRFNPNSARRPQKHPSKRAFKGPNRGRLSGHPLGGWPTDVWDDIRHLRHNAGEKTTHPCQYPEALAIRAALLYTLPGDTIGDVFSGSGSTQAAAIRTGRAHIGGDVAYADLRHERLSLVKADTVTPLAGVTPESMAIWEAEMRRVDTPAQPISARAEDQLILSFCGGQSQCANRPRQGGGTHPA